MSLLPHSQYASMANHMGTLFLREDFVRVTHYLLTYSCYMQKGSQLCWQDQKRRGDLMGLRFVEVHLVYPILFANDSLLFCQES